jgi:GMP synthase (glutamine-hydrolysing)
MRVLTIVHELDAGPGVFTGPLATAGAEVEVWLPTEQPEPPAPATTYGAILSFGGSAHPHQEERHPWLVTEKRFLAGALAAGVPLLGVCLGSELIAEAAGGRARHMAQPEIGWYPVQLTEAGRADPVTGPLGDSFEALEWHSYTIEPPPGAAALAHGPSCLQAYRLGERAWGVQFHPEVTGEDFQHWLDNYTIDEDAVRVGVDPSAIAAQCADRMPDWHALGAGLCTRFMEAAGA